MTALEYLTENSLISHPFKSRKAGNADLANDWFYDIVFVSYTPTIRSVYVSNITKSSSTSLSLSFSNSETLALICTLQIEDSEFVSHYNNTTKSCFSYSDNINYAVKIVLGPGLLDYALFTRDYLKGETELANSAVVLACPIVDSIVFGKYTSSSYDVNGDPQMVAVTSITPTSGAAKLRFLHNLTFNEELKNLGGISVIAGAGAGLYDDCPLRDPNVYTINGVAPNPSGSLFLNPSTCYSIELLTQKLKDDLTYDSNGDPLNILNNYFSFDAYTGPSTQTNLDVVTPGHSLVLQNFCSPKCSPDTMSAFAYYLNRVTDGAADLDKIATGKVETRGKGYRISSSTFGVQPGYFCIDDLASPFRRCAVTDDIPAASKISCGTSFLKNYHEGRTLEVYHSAGDIRTHTIAEVVDANTVRVADSTALGAWAGDLFFRVTDNGVISNMNCAAKGYNDLADNYNKPYFEARYVLSESFNAASEYGTLVSVVVALFNPSANIVTLDVEFSPTVLIKQGDIKIRKAGNVKAVTDANVTLNCREYAFVEAIYFIKCATLGGVLNIAVTDLTLGGLGTSLGTYSISPVNGADCIGTLTGTVNSYLVTQDTGATFEKFEPWPKDTTSVSSTLLGSSPPSWLIYTPDHELSPSSKAVRLTTDSAALLTATNSALYTLYYRVYAPGTSGAISQVVIDYVARPQILSPLSATYPSSSPIVITIDDTFTEASPLFIITAKNMVRLSTQTNSSQFKYAATVNGTDPLSTIGLEINEITGRVFGNLDDAIVKGSVIQLSITATNPAGVSTVETVHIQAAVDSVPVITLNTAPPYVIDSVVTYTEASPLFTFTTTNGPILRYTLSTVPAGFTFNSLTGTLTGRLPLDATPYSTIGTYSLTATNVYGTSDPVTFDLQWNEVYQPPVITEPLNDVSADYRYVGTLFNVVSTSSPNIPPVTYTATGLPPSFYISDSTQPTGENIGVVQGYLSSTEYPPNYLTQTSSFSYAVELFATNLAGTTSKKIKLTFSTESLPVIDNNPGTLYPLKAFGYTSAAPLYTYTVAPISGIISFTITSGTMPLGLTLSSTGIITGSIPQTVDSEINAIQIAPKLNFSGFNPYNLGPGVGRAVTTRIVVPFVFTSHPPAATTYTYKYNLGTPITPVEFKTCASKNRLIGNISTFPTTALSLTGLSLVQAARTSGQPAIATLEGTPTRVGTYSFVARAFSGDSTIGNATTPLIVVQITEKTYTISGTVLLDGTALEGVTVAYEEISTITNTSGAYTLAGLIPGNYIVSVSKQGYFFDVSSRAVNVSTANVAGVNFSAVGPLRQVSGKITTPDSLPLGGVTVGNGARTVNTDDQGNYTLASGTAALTITPASTAYRFTPTSISLTTGTLDITGQDFTATFVESIPAPTDLVITPANASLLLSFNVLTSNVPYTSRYEYNWFSADTSTSSGWTTLTTTSAPGDPTTILNATISGLINGTGYSVQVRAVNTAGKVGTVSSTVYGVPATQAAAPSFSAAAADASFVITVTSN